MRQVEDEIARQDWKGMRCGCGRSAAHIARELLRITAGGARDEATSRDFEQHVWSPVVLYEPAPAVTSVLLAALAAEPAPDTRFRLLDLLQSLVTGEGTDPDSARRGLDLPELCRERAARGIELLHREVLSNRSPGAAGAAFEILTVLDPDRARLRDLRETAADWLPVCCRTGLCHDWWEDEEESRKAAG
ncbi:hypothetical protein [Streptomyces sp. NPDC048606]|uniref:hypothetical protein n=1 Tax=Streptomyces sp. NPDC048606 TaxID=3154726 RepID=UPI003442B151